MIKNKTIPEIRKFFSIENDFTPEEEAQIMEENKWAEESFWYSIVRLIMLQTFIPFFLRKFKQKISNKNDYFCTQKTHLELLCFPGSELSGWVTLLLEWGKRKNTHTLTLTKISQSQAWNFKIILTSWQCALWLSYSENKSPTYWL